MPRKPKQPGLVVTAAAATVSATVAYPREDDPTDEMGPYDRLALAAKRRAVEAVGDIDADVAHAGIADVDDPLATLHEVAIDGDEPQ